MLPSQFCRLSASVREHLSDLGGQSGNDRGVEQRVKSGKQDTADHHADDDLDSRVDIALCALFGNNILRGSNRLLELGSDLVDAVMREEKTKNETI